MNNSTHTQHRLAKLDFLRNLPPIVLALIATLATIPCHVNAEGSGDVTGQVINAVTEAQLSRARVAVPGTRIETFTNDFGFYRLTGLEPGTVELVITYLGFVSQRKQVTVVGGETTVANFAMMREGLRTRFHEDADGELHELAPFEVVAEREMSAQALAMTEQRFAPNIKSVVAMDTLGDRGDENIGEYLRFLPGVAVLEESGTASSISLRGFDASMTNISLDGAEVASSAEGSTRTVSLAEVPMINVERLEVTKVPTPDMSASGLGGSVNLITRSNLGRTTPLLRYQVSFLMNTLEGLSLRGGPQRPRDELTRSWKKPSYSMSYILPVSDRIGFNFGYSNTWRQFPFEEPQQTPEWFNLTDQPFQWRSVWDMVAETRTSESFQLGAEWKIGPNTIVTFGGQIRDSYRYRVTNRFIVEFQNTASGDATFTQSDPSGNALVRQGRNTNLEYDTEAKHVNLKLEHFGRVWRITLQGSYAHSATEIGSLAKGHFAWVHSAIIQLQMRGEGIGEGGSRIPTLFSAVDRSGNPVDVYDGANYSINDVRVDEYEYSTARWFGRFDIGRSFGSHLEFKTGAVWDFMEKDTVRNIPTYMFRPNGESAIAARRAGNFDVFDDNFELPIFGVPYRWISDRKVYDLYLRHPDWFVENRGTTITNLVNNSKLLRETVTAGYLRADLRFLPGNRLWIVTGIRYERTDVEGFGMRDDPSMQYLKNEDGSLRLRGGQPMPISTDPGVLAAARYTERGARTRRHYDDYFPSLNASYAITDTLMLRFAYARTMGRPNIDHIVPGYRLPDPDAFTGTDASKIRVNNTGLEPWTANSFDLSLESYMFRDGFGSIGIFHKIVSKFFASVETPATDELLRSFGFPEQEIASGEWLNFPIVSLYNSGEAKLTGVEFGYRQSLTFLPDWARGFQVFANATHMKLGGENAADFSNFNPTTFSWGINLVRPNFYIKLTADIQSKTRQAPTPANANNGIPEGTYRYQTARERYSLSVQYSFSRAFSIFGSITDIGGFNIDNLRYAPGTPEYARKFTYRRLGSNVTIGVRGVF